MVCDFLKSLNQIVGCTIEGNHKVGVLFRTPLSEFRGAHRNQIESCVIRNNGFAENGYGIDIRGLTHKVKILGNRIEDSGEGMQKIGIHIERGALGTVIEGNAFSNLALDIEEE